MTMCIFPTSSAGKSTAYAALQSEIMPKRPATATLYLKVFLRSFMGSPFSRKIPKLEANRKVLRPEGNVPAHTEKAFLQGAFSGLRQTNPICGHGHRIEMSLRVYYIIISFGNLFLVLCQ
ncbi:MAG: hypothetical protein IJD65_04475 [Mailhella sp.]|nr:hypothetical protein [Mailhella sp.]